MSDWYDDKDGQADTINHEFPLRPGMVVEIGGLPVDLTVTEAKRLYMFLISMITADLKMNVTFTDGPNVSSQG